MNILEEPGENRFRHRLLVGTVEKNLRLFLIRLEEVITSRSRL